MNSQEKKGAQTIEKSVIPEKSTDWRLCVAPMIDGTDPKEKAQGVNALGLVGSRWLH